MEYFLSFLAYSFLGWLCETIYCSCGAKHFVNRGFLAGPLCPVYGFGAMAVLIFLRPVRDSIVMTFLCGMIVTSIIEYITAYLLETLFATKWWDYSTYRFNIHGRVCLKNSLMFGALSVVAARYIDPFIQGIILAIPLWGKITLTSVLAVIFVVDFVVTVHTILELNGTLKQLQTLAEQIRSETETYLEQTRQGLKDKVEQNILGLELEKIEMRNYLEGRKTERMERLEERRKERLQKLEEEHQEIMSRLETRVKEFTTRNSFLRRRLIRAFPNMRPIRYEKSFERIKEELFQKKEK